MSGLFRFLALCRLPLWLTIILLTISIQSVAAEGSSDDLEPMTADNAYLVKQLITLDGENSAVFSADGTTVATEFFSEIRIFDVLTGERVTTLDNGTTISILAGSPDGALLASAQRDGSIGLWDVQTETRIRWLTGHGDSVNDMAFSPDGTRLASASRDRTIRIWDVQTGKKLRVLDAGTLVESVAFSPDGTRLASGDWSELKLWDVETGTKLTSLDQGGHVNSVAFSADGTRLASASGDVRLWDTQTNEEIAVLRGTTVAFSPDGSLLASTSGEVIWLWDAQTGQELTSLAGHGSEVWGVAFSPDGTRLASLGWHRLQIWGVPAAEANSAVERSGVTVNVSGEVTQAFDNAVPAEWMAAPDTLPRYEIRIVSIATIVENCSYTVATLTRRRIDVKATIIDLVTGEPIASQEFLGEAPGLCGATENLSIAGGNYRDGAPPNTTDFEAWLTEAMSQTDVEQ